jgi:hypothetical protein
MKPKDYVAMEFWYKRLCAYPNTILSLQAKAVAAGAPINAIYYSIPSKKWITLDDLTPDHPFRPLYEEFLRKRHGTKV